MLYRDNETIIHQVGCEKVPSIEDGTKNVKTDHTQCKWLGPYRLSHLEKLLIWYPEYKVMFCKKCFRELYYGKKSRNQIIYRRKK